MSVTQLIQKSLARANIKVSRAVPRVNPQRELYEKLFGQQAVAEKRFFNVGSGSFHHPLWSNIDYVSEWYRSVQKDVIHHDLMSGEPLPIRDGHACIIYTSHTIEHVKDEAVERLFQEAYRSLMPGGYFRVTTGPDAETNYSALMRNDEDWFYWDRMYDAPGTFEEIFHRPASSVPIEERWLHHVASPLAPNDRCEAARKFTAPEIRSILDRMGMEGALNYFTDLCEFQPDLPRLHISWWTHDKVINLMRKVGFKEVYRSGYGQSRCAPLRNTALFDNTHPQMSLYVEAIR
jgi:SAM-dependent methyltransferase